MKYLKHFETEAEYVQFKNSEDFVLPNISYIEEINGVMFNPDVALVSPNFVCVYNVTDTSRETKIISEYAGYQFISMIVDGVEADVDTYYQFDTEGSHTVEFIIDENHSDRNEPYFFGYLFENIDALVSVTIPNSVASIGESAFENCFSLTEVTIPNSVTLIKTNAFYGCSSLTTIYCEATTPPTLEGTYVFDDNADGRKIYVPTGSVDAYKAAQYWSEYADAIVG